jgi:hypothetical protein
MPGFFLCDRQWKFRRVGALLKDVIFQRMAFGLLPYETHGQLIVTESQHTLSKSKVPLLCQLELTVQCLAQFRGADRTNNVTSIQLLA